MNASDTRRRSSVTVHQVFNGPVRSVTRNSIVMESNGRVGSGSMVIGNNRGVVQQRAVQGVFGSVELTGSAEIVITRSDRCAVEVHGEENLVDFVETKLVGTSLYVGLRDGVSFTSHLPLKVVATAPSIIGVVLRGSGTATLRDLAQPGLEVVVNGSGTVVADGKVDSVLLTIHGSGEIDTRQLKAKTAAIAIRGSGEISAFARTNAEVEVCGSGDVTVQGRPKTRSAKVCGSGEISFDD